MKNKTVGIIGIALFIIGIILIFINDFVESSFLKSLAEYGRYFSIFGGGLIGVGFFRKRKNK